VRGFNPEGKLDTGIYIRAYLRGKAKSVDIGDANLDAEQLLRWLAGLPDEGVLRAIETVRTVIAVDNVNARYKNDD
jgi:hypothetical protein